MTGELSVEEIRKKYAGAYEHDLEEQLSTSSEMEDGTESEVSEEEEESEQEEMETEDEESEEVGIDYLTKNLDVEEPAVLKVSMSSCCNQISSPHSEPTILELSVSLMVHRVGQRNKKALLKPIWRFPSSFGSCLRLHHL